MSMRDHESASGALEGSCPLVSAHTRHSRVPREFLGFPCVCGSEPGSPSLTHLCGAHPAGRQAPGSVLLPTPRWLLCLSIFVCVPVSVTLGRRSLSLCVSRASLCIVSGILSCMSRASPLCRSLSKFLQDPAAARCWRVAQKFGVLEREVRVKWLLCLRIFLGCLCVSCLLPERCRKGGGGGEVSCSQARCVFLPKRSFGKPGLELPRVGRGLLLRHLGARKRGGGLQSSRSGGEA